MCDFVSKIIKLTFCPPYIDACAERPCLNNGNFTDEVNGYICYCHEGISGSQCQTCMLTYGQSNF